MNHKIKEKLREVKWEKAWKRLEKDLRINQLVK